MVETTGIFANLLLSTGEKTQLNQGASSPPCPQPTRKLLPVVRWDWHHLETLMPVPPAHAVPQQHCLPAALPAQSQQ